MIDADFDDLERELAAMAPAAPSTRLRDRLAGSLSPSPSRRIGPASMFFGGLIAASAAIWMLWSDGQPRIRPVRVASSPIDRPVVPTLAAYRQAMSDSPESFERMLEQTGRSSTSEPDPPIAFRSLLDGSFSY